MGWVQFNLWPRPADPIPLGWAWYPEAPAGFPGRVPNIGGELWPAVVGQGRVCLPICLAASISPSRGADRQPVSPRPQGTLRPSLPSPRSLRPACGGGAWGLLGGFQAAEPCLHGRPGWLTCASSQSGLCHAAVLPGPWGGRRPGPPCLESSKKGSGLG